MELSSSSEIDDSRGEFSEIGIGFGRMVLGFARGFEKATWGARRRKRSGRGLKGGIRADLGREFGLD